GVSCAHPVYDAAGRLRGVFTADFDLNMLSQFVRQLSVSPHSRLFIMSSDGEVLGHPTHRTPTQANARGRGKLTRVEELDDPLVAAVLADGVLPARLAGRVSRPILSLVPFMGAVGQGDLTRRVNLGGAREFRQLSAALERMIADLRDRMRLRGAMAVATEVQQA